ncbi:MAG: hypothetical protein DRG87_06945 [Deltaproteobacteria bacterium]|nr:MAG: hypothetical protein DRG87_06945 [Deltaproteobacteria bacterium]
MRKLGIPYGRRVGSALDMGQIAHSSKLKAQSKKKLPGEIGPFLNLCFAISSKSSKEKEV